MVSFLWRRMKCLMGMHFALPHDYHNADYLGQNERRYICIRHGCKHTRVVKLYYAGYREGFREEGQ